MEGRGEFVSSNAGAANRLRRKKKKKGVEQSTQIKDPHAFVSLFLILRPNKSTLPYQKKSDQREGRV
jgi:hypothetical protein